MRAGKWLLILKLEDDIYICTGRIFDIFLVFVSRDFELGRKLRCDLRKIFRPISMKFGT